MDIVAFADTHGKHDRISLPDADVAVFAGDACGYGDMEELLAFLDWYEKQLPTYKIMIAGNHDWPFEKYPEDARSVVENRNIIYLQDEEIFINGVFFWGAPWTPEFNDWAFNVPRGPSLREKWDKIPSHADVVVTHGMPYDTGDMVRRFDVWQPMGDKELRAAIERVQPRYYIGGHLHAGYGMYRVGETDVVNATQVNERYALANEPVTLQIEN